MSSLSPNEISSILNKNQIESALAKQILPTWVSDSYSAFVAIINQPEYPCFYASLAERRGMIQYSIALSLKNLDSFKNTLEAIDLYFSRVDALAQRGIEDELLSTLVIFLPPASEPLELQEYAEQAWNFLNTLVSIDEVPWPTNIPMNPQEKGWSYVLRGRPIFVNVSTPAHCNRRSRNLGPGMILIINPRDLFERVIDRWGPEPRLNIYERQRQYDNLPPYPPHLASRDESNSGDELLLYLSPDNNEQKIPFNFNHGVGLVSNNSCPVQNDIPGIES